MKCREGEGEAHSLQFLGYGHRSPPETPCLEVRFYYPLAQSHRSESEKSPEYGRTHPGRYPLGGPRNLGDAFRHSLDQEREWTSRRDRGQRTLDGSGLRFFVIRREQDFK